MKKIYSYLCAAAAVLSAASCQKGFTDDSALDTADGYRFSASIVATKTVLMDNVKTYWEKGDNITVFDADNNPVTFVGQQTGTVATADFLAETYNPGTKAYAIYPANDEATLEDNTISGLYIAAEQTAVAGGFDPQYAIAVGEETSAGTLTFSNAHSLVKFTILGESPSKVTFTNGGSKAIAGNVSYDLPTGKTTVAASGSSKEIVLKPAAGETFESGETYYIAFCADGSLSDMSLKFDDVVVKEVPGEKAAANGKVFNLGTVAKEMVEVTANYLYGSAYEDHDGVYAYYLLLSDNGYADEEYNFNPDSKYFSIGLFAYLEDESTSTVVPDGIYSFDLDETYASGTLDAYNSYLLAIDEELNESEYYFVGGQAKVTEDGIDLIIEDEDGTVYHVTYEGAPDFSASAGDYLSTLNDDVEIDIEDGSFSVEKDSDYDVDGFTYYLITLNGNDNSVLFELLSDNPEGFIGKYTSLSTDADELYNCFIPYSAYFEAQGYLGSYYATSEDFAPLSYGELTISEEGGVYTFEFDCWDDAGHYVGGIFKGTEE